MLKICKVFFFLMILINYLYCMYTILDFHTFFSGHLFLLGLVLTVKLVFRNVTLTFSGYDSVDYHQI